jgi:hypothetical protein
MVMYQLTDLPESHDELGDYAQRSDRMRTEGTRNLLAARAAAGAPRFLGQCIAWRPSGRGHVVDEHERQMLAAGGVVIRYGQLYGPGTFYEDELPPHPRIQIDQAVSETRGLLDAQPGIVTVVESESAENA